MALRGVPATFTSFYFSASTRTEAPHPRLHTHALFSELYTLPAAGLAMQAPHCKLLSPPRLHSGRPGPGSLLRLLRAGGLAS